MKSFTGTRWLVLVTDGRHVTLGRHRDPDPEEIANSEKALAEQGLAGWLVLMKGAYYDSRKRPELMMVRPLGEPQGSWEASVASFETHWKLAVRPTPAERKNAERHPSSDQPP